MGAALVDFSLDSGGAGKTPTLLSEGKKTLVWTCYLPDVQTFEKGDRSFESDRQVILRGDHVHFCQRAAGTELQVNNTADKHVGPALSGYRSHSFSMTKEQTLAMDGLNNQEARRVLSVARKKTVLFGGEETAP